MMTKILTSTVPPKPIPAPWWSFAHVWMVIAGPVAVVIAGFVTLYLAIRTPDPVLQNDNYQRGIHINQNPSVKAPVPFRYAPAAAARNHAATGEMPAVPLAASASAVAQAAGSRP